ncbi:flagellar hook capping FlgD N-terminal domain-containing protein [Dinoroseobacter sp. S124A]|uniref:flagellar hook capping FlgD N-terminal domain-containing protein n=1 Tax=Dinoroseobacter sp. S124A TaxID=3415128 RepID=UPI003C7E0010
MDAVSGVTSTTAQTSTSSSSNSATAIASDFETFLTMLTTQLENQDPLDPVDSQDLAVQLATFSGVEQQTRTNALLEDLGGQMGLMNLSQLASWVGMDALASGELYFDGSPIEIRPEIPAVADTAELVVFRSDGTEVQRLAMDTSAETALWAGVGADGNPLPDGAYTLAVASTARGEELPLGQVSAYREVLEVKASGGGTQLVTEGGIEVDSSSVISLRQPL